MKKTALRASIINSIAQGLVWLLFAWLNILPERVLFAMWIAGSIQFYFGYVDALRK